MALQDILAAITAEADKKIAEARAQHQRELTRIREESERTLARRKQEIAIAKQQKMDQLRNKTQTHALSHKRNVVLAKKKELLDRTYESAVNALAGMNDTDAEKLLRACVKSIKDKGTIHASKKHEAMLKKICPSEQFEMGKATDAKGGFLFVSKKTDQDFTFERIVLDIIRPKTELTVSQILFS